VLYYLSFPFEKKKNPIAAGISCSTKNISKIPLNDIKALYNEIKKIIKPETMVNPGFEKTPPAKRSTPKTNIPIPV